MILSSTFRLSAMPAGFLLEATPDALSLTADNVAATPLTVRFYDGDGDQRTARTAYLTLEVRSGESVLYTYRSTTAISSYTYNWPSASYATADNIRLRAYAESGRTTLLGEKVVNLVTANPVPFPRSETSWGTSLTFKNGEFLLLDGVVYMWVSRVPGNTDVDPKTYIAQGTLPRVWTSYEEWPMLATQVMLAQYALLGGFVVDGDRLFSRQGLLNGAESTNYKAEGFDPNTLINALTGLIKTRKLEAEGAKIEGEVTADSGRIGGFTLTPASIQSAGYGSFNQAKFFLFSSGEPYLCFYDEDGRWVGIGLNTSAALSIPTMLRVEDTAESIEQKIGIYFSVKNGLMPTGANTINSQPALLIDDGHIAGLRRRLRSTTTSTTITNLDGIVVFAHSSGTVTATLPANPENGQEVWLISSLAQRVNVRTTDGTSIQSGGNTFASNRFHVYVYCASLGTWYYSYMNEN